MKFFLLLSIFIFVTPSCLRKYCLYDLHIHIDDSFSPEFALSLIHKYDPNNEIQTIDDLKKFIAIKSYQEFIIKWVWISSFFRQIEDYYNMAYDVVKILSKRNVIYAEFNFDPLPPSNSKNLTTYQITQAVIKGLKQGYQDFGFFSNLILDFERASPRFNELLGIHILEELKEFMDIPAPRICAINLSGQEPKNSSLEFMKLYEHARNLGLNTTVHSGEDGDTEEIWGAIKNLKPDRIGHGVKIYKDPQLMEYFKKFSIPMECCVTSNLKTETIKGDITNHPIKMFFDYGIKVFMNSDDPLFWGNYIDDEVKIIKAAFNFTESDIEQMLINAFESAFLTTKERRYLWEKCFERCKMQN